MSPMLLPLLFYHFASKDNSASALTATIPEAQVARSTCDGASSCRTSWNIVISCLSTIFLTSWIVIHPNVSYPIDAKDQRRWHSVRIFLTERVPLFLIALVYPEYILAWAIRQRLAAREVTNIEGELLPSWSIVEYTNCSQAGVWLKLIC